MAKDVENLQISINLDTGDFNSQIKNINQGLKDLEKQFKTLDKGLDSDSFQHYALEIDKSRKAIEMLEKQTEAYKKKQEALLQTIEKQKKKQQELNESDKDYDKKYERLEKQINKNQRAYDSLGNSIATNGTKIKNYANDILDANQAVQKLANNAQTLEQKLSKINLDEKLNMSNIDRQMSSMSKYATALQKMGLEIDKMNSKKNSNTSQINEYNKSIQKLENNQKDLLNKQKQLNQEIQKHKTYLSTASAEYGESSQEVSKLQMSLAKLQDELREVNGELDGNADSLAEYRTNVNQLEAENNRLNQSLATVRWDTWSNTLSKAGHTLKNVGRDMTQYVTTPIVAGGVAVAKMGMDYQQNLAKLSVITGMEGQALQNYGEELIDISNTTGIAITDIMESTYDALSSGVSVGDSLAFIKDASNLATAGFAQQADAVNLLTNAYNIYGKEALGATEEVNDKLLKTQDLSKATVGQLATTMSEAMAVGGSYGVNLDNILASYTKLTLSGYSAEQSTTKLVRMIDELGNSGTKVGETFEKVAGQSFKSFMENGGTLYDALMLIKDGANLSTEGLTQLFGSSEAGQAVLALLSDEAGNFNEIMKEIGNSSGTTQEALEKLNSTGGKQLANAVNELKNSFIDFGIAMTPMIEKVAEFIKKIAEGLSEMDDGTKESILKMAGLVATIGPLLTMVGQLLLMGSGIAQLGGFISSIGASATASASATGGLVSALGGISLATAGIVATVGAIAGIAVAVGDSTTALSHMIREWGVLGDTISGICEMINGVFQLTIGNIWENLKGLGKGIMALFKGDFSQLDDIWRETLANVRANTNEAMSDITMSTTRALNTMNKCTKEELSGVSDIFNNEFKNLVNLTSENADEVAKTFTDKMVNMKGDQINVMRGMGGEIGATLFKGIHEGMGEKAMQSQLSKNLNELLRAGLIDESEISNILDTFNSQVEKCVKDSGTNFKQAGTELFNNIKDGLKSGNWDEAFKDASKSMDNWTQEMIDKQASFSEEWGALLEGVTENMSSKEMYSQMLQNAQAYCDAHGLTWEQFIQGLREGQIEAHEILDETNEAIKEATKEGAEKTKEQLADSFESLDMDVKVKLKTEFEGVDEAQLYNIHTILEQFPDEIQTKLKGEGFKEVLKDAKDTEDFLKKLEQPKLVEIMSDVQFAGSLTLEELQIAVDRLPDEKVVELLANTKYVGSLTPEQLAIYLNTLPEEQRVEVISDFIQKGKLTPEQLKSSLETLPTSKITEIILEAKESGKYTTEQINEMLLSLPPEVRTVVETYIQEYGTLENYKNSIEDIPTDKKTNIEVTETNPGKAEEVKQEITEVPNKKDAIVNVLFGDGSGLEKGKEVENLPNSKNMSVNMSKGDTSGLDAVKEAEKKEDVDIKVNVKQGDTSFWDGLGAWLKSKAQQNEQTITIKAKVGEVDTSSTAKIKIDPIKIDAKTNAVDARTITNFKADPITIEAKVGTVDTSALTNITPPTITITANVTGANLVTALKTSISSIQSKTVNVTASVVGANLVTALKTSISTLQGKSVKVTASVTGTALITTLISTINKVKDKTVKVTANVKGTDAVNKLVNAIKNVKSKSVKISATTSGVTAVKNLATAIGNVRSRSVTVKANVQKTVTEQSASVSEASYTPSPTSLLTSDIVSASNGIAPIDVPVTASATSGNLFDLKKILPSIDFDVDMFKNLEEALKNLEAQLGVIDKKMDGTFGQERVNLLQQQIPLLKQQQIIQEKLIKGQREQNSELTKWLKSQGFTFNNLGEITNYNDKLLAMEQNVDSLKKKYDALNDVEKKNESAVKSAKDAYDKANDTLSKTKDYLSAYFETNNTAILEATEKWYDYENQINEVQQAVKELAKELKELNIDSGYKNVERDIAELNNQLEMNDILLDRANGDEAIKLLEEKIKLTQQLQKETQDLINYEKQLRNGLMSELSQYGFSFRDDGSIVGYSQKIEALKKTLSDEEFENVFEKIEEYIEKTTETIPNLQVEYEKFNNEILDSKENIKDVQDEIAETTKKLSKELKELNEDTGYKNVERDISEIEALLKINDAKLNKANGQEKIDLLEEQISLTQQLQKETNDLLSYEEQRRSNLMSELNGYGFKFRENGSMEGYGGIIANLKKTLSDEEFDEVFKKVEDYLETTYETIPNITAELIEMNDTITDSRDEVEELERQMRLLYQNSQLTMLNNEFDKLSSSLDIINNKLKYAYGSEQIDLMNESISLLNQQLEIQEDKLGIINNQLGYYKDSLQNYGFEFDDLGNITNYVEVMSWFSNTDSLEKINDLTEEYFDKCKELQDITEGYEDLKVAIKDVYKEQLEIVESVEGKITDVIEKEVEKRKDEIESYTDEQIKLLQKIQDEYDALRDAQNYEASVEDQKKEIEKLNKLIETAKRDTSLSGQQRLNDLMKQLTEAEKELEKITQDKIDADFKNNIDSEIDKLESEQDRFIKSLEKQFSDTNIAKIVQQALTSGFLEINNEVQTLQDVLLDSINNSADAYSIMSGVIKDELITNLNTALQVMQNMESVYKGLDLQNVDYSSVARYSPNADTSSSNKTVNNNVEFNPTININSVNGEVDVEAIRQELQKQMDEMLNKLARDL